MYNQEHDEKVNLLRKQDVKGVDYSKMERKEIESLELILCLEQLKSSLWPK